jgi:hypothetical protein
MSRFARPLQRALLPVGVFLAAAVAHYVWRGLFPEQAAAQAGWAAVDVGDDPSWLGHYIEAQDYWLGFTYALSFAFAATALRRYREERFCAARTLAIGGITLSGFLAVAGCYLLGCCGSPMLAVYLNLFGATFLPLAKPLVAAFSTISILAAWFWMHYARPASLHTTHVAPASGDASCTCDER